MSDDIVFCARTGKQIVDPPRVAKSNVIPFPRRRTAKPKPAALESYVEAVTIPYSGTLADIDEAARAEVSAFGERTQEENDDI